MGIHVEKAVRKRTCYTCGVSIPVGEYCIKIYVGSKGRSFCPTCVIRPIVELLAIKEQEVLLDKNSARLLKEHFVEEMI